MDKQDTTVTYANLACPCVTLDHSCLAISSPIPPTWYCPTVESYLSSRKKRDETKNTFAPAEALSLSHICVCKTKAESNTKLLECHNSNCSNGKFFLRGRLSYKRFPNNSKSTWQCSTCRGLLPKACHHTCLSFCPDPGTSWCTTPTPYPGTGWCTTPYPGTGWCTTPYPGTSSCNPLMEGFQIPTLGPVRNFTRMIGEFIPILHTGSQHWVCVSSLGCLPGMVNLYDSLFHDIIETEVEEQVKRMMVGAYIGLENVSVWQQNNGSDCGVLTIAFVLNPKMWISTLEKYTHIFLVV